MSKFDEIKEELGTSNLGLNIGLSNGMPVNTNKGFFEDAIKLAKSLCYTEGHEIITSTEVKDAFFIENTNDIFKLNRLKSISRADENFLMELINFIEKEWHNIGLKVDDLSSSLGMSKTLIYKKMIVLTGKSPNSFIREYRLNRALEELNLNMKSISEIAFQSGFNSTSYFSKCFKKRFGILPSAYIKS
jgi:AraC-like DNA-binding protein